MIGLKRSIFSRARVASAMSSSAWKIENMGAEEGCGRADNKNYFIVS